MAPSRATYWIDRIKLGAIFVNIFMPPVPGGLATIGIPDPADCPNTTFFPRSFKMSKIMRRSITIILTVFFCATVAFAADQDRNRKKEQDKKKDGSCQTDLLEGMNGRILAADQDRDRKKEQDNAKDGSSRA